MIRILLFFGSILIFLLSLFIHLLSSFGMQTPKWSMAIHGLIFLFFVPGIFFLLADLKEVKKKDPKMDTLDILKSGPKILFYLTFLFQIYTLGNFFIRLGSLGNAQPHFDGENYYISGRDVPTRNITKEEYDSMKSTQEAAFSGHWMLFLSGSMLMLYPFRNLKTIEREKKEEEGYDFQSIVNLDSRFKARNSGLIFQTEPFEFWDRILFDKASIFLFLGVFLSYVLSYLYPAAFLFSMIGTLMMIGHIFSNRYFLFRVYADEKTIQLEYLDFFSKKNKNLPASFLSLQLLEKSHSSSELHFFENGKKLFFLRTDSPHYSYDSLRTLLEILNQFHPHSQSSEK